MPRAAVIPLAVGWSDVGAWDSLWKVLLKDESGNALRGIAAEDAPRESASIVQHQPEADRLSREQPRHEREQKLPEERTRKPLHALRSTLAAST